MQAFDGRRGLALQDGAGTQRFHAQHADAGLDQHRHDAVLEAVEMRVHDVQRHLHRVKLKLVVGGH